MIIGCVVIFDGSLIFIRVLLGCTRPHAFPSIIKKKNLKIYLKKEEEEK